MLTALRIGNFKAFADTQRVSIRPLTFLYADRVAIYADFQRNTSPYELVAEVPW